MELEQDNFGDMNNFVGKDIDIVILFETGLQIGLAKAGKFWLGAIWVAIGCVHQPFIDNNWIDIMS